MPSLQVEFEVYCSCGAGICNNVEVTTNRRGEGVVTVQPCEACLQGKYDEGYQDGIDEEDE